MFEWTFLGIPGGSWFRMALAFAWLMSALTLGFYYLGGFLYYHTQFKRLGHYFVAVSGLRPSWLWKECPYKSGTCRIWNCPKYHSCGG